MKIVVYNSHGQYALSRAEVDALQSVLPKQLWSSIKEIHLAHSHPRKVEPFEFDAALGIAYLICPVGQKTSELRTQAITDLLVGLARVQAKSRFFLPLKEREAQGYSELLERWLPECEAAMVRLHASA
jgi:hypothetical protein